MPTTQGQRDYLPASESQPMDDPRGAGVQDVIDDAADGDKSRLLWQFRVGESIEYYSRYHKGAWMPAIVQKIDEHALRINVAGYRDTRRILASDIQTKIRKTEKTKGK
ncbi:unknown protein [Seminavis robusta]|uniref:Uncharacterized protein n=1 Tax=Seminavis robusta TaxID=568900 RepID=A0A9N8EUF1_9STRA|nr:unknown protein [Seminavis robusta]|eukprot:Sro1603_g285330.1 n/a (108) ;mRNA; r:18161-18484